MTKKIVILTTDTNHHKYFVFSLQSFYRNNCAYLEAPNKKSKIFETHFFSTAISGRNKIKVDPLKLFRVMVA